MSTIQDQTDHRLTALEAQALFHERLLGWPARADSIRQDLVANAGEPWAAPMYERLKTVALALSNAPCNPHAYELPAELTPAA